MSGTSKQTWCCPPSGFFSRNFAIGEFVAKRLDQLDLRIGRVDKADAHALRGQVERRAVRLGAEHGR